MTKYPIGLQNFQGLREDGYLYIDKTMFIHELVSRGKYYFLSRPRRFGKSLLVTTMEAYFLGKKELFKGLAMERLEKEWKTYPVFHIDLNTGKYTSPEALNDIINEHLLRFEKTYGYDPMVTTLSGRFANVIRRAHEQTGQRAVILVDEYAKPFEHDPRKLYRIGVNFSSVTKRMDGWKLG